MQWDACGILPWPQVIDFLSSTVVVVQVHQKQKTNSFIFEIKVYMNISLSQVWYQTGTNFFCIYSLGYDTHFTRHRDNKLNYLKKTVTI